MPVEVKRYLSVRLVEKQLTIQGGLAGIIEWLYRGDQRAEFVGLPVAHPSGTIRFDARGIELWPQVAADTKRWLDERASKKAPTHPGRPI
ncbi:MAG TPA: hypothetical protein VGI97_14645 [Gemmatimonadaceae bacterium]